eukprot:TRINITY_DN6193_c0_g2_i1.p1 TRINITY_DN6193_c0_g2~~TRINITY_DN6193_c0_g2_i1.p1  ORF type:complete len:378 (-),score=47.74 TRINITY_DN6193_c0_g2_i1:270-1403(-)
MQASQIGPEINALGKYTWLQLLGQGGFGIVGKAQNNQTNEIVAIKVLDRLLLQQERNPDRLRESKKRVFREIIHQKKLSGHPLIVEFKEVFLTPRFLCIVMEYAQGGDMFKYVIDCYRNKTPLTEDEARAWFQQLIIALRFCHQNHIVNRDIKLENTLRAYNAQGPLRGWWGEKDKCKRDEHIWFGKLCDFGYSKDLENNSAPESRVGSLPYASPEVLYAGPGEVYDGEKRDVWSCGVMLYTLMVCSYPFDPRKHSHPILFEMIKNGSFRFPEKTTISRQAQQLIRGMLEPNPKRRLSVSSIVSNSWFKKNLPTSWNFDFKQRLQERQQILQSDEEIERLVEEVFATQLQEPQMNHDIDGLDSFISEELLDADIDIA